MSIADVRTVDDGPVEPQREIDVVLGYLRGGVQDLHNLTAKDEKAARPAASSSAASVTSTARAPRRSSSLGCSFRRLSSLSTQPDRDLLPEIVEYDAFVAESGAQGGWHPDDHSEFMRLLQAAKGDFAACEAAVTAQLFHIPPADVAEHARWHARHEDLLQHKRAAIKRWRDEKKAAQLVLQEEAEQERSLSRESDKQKLKLRRQESRQSVRQWQAQRDLQRQATLEEAKAEAAAAAASHTAAWEAERIRKREIADAYREKKRNRETFVKQAVQQQEAMARRQQEEERARMEAAPTPGQILAAEARSEAHLERRLAMLRLKEERREAEQQRLDALSQEAADIVNARAEADPQRLLAPTESYCQKSAAEAPGPVRFGGTSIRTVQRKAVPMWARGTR